MKSPRVFLVVLSVLILINVGLYLWNNNLDEQTRPQEVGFLKDLPEHSIQGIAFDPKNNLWVYGDFGIKVYDNGRPILAFSNNFVNATNFGRLNSVQRFYFDRLGRTWFMGDNSLYVLNNGQWDIYDQTFLGLQNDRIVCLAFDKENRAWICTQSKRILILEGSQLEERKTPALDSRAIYLDNITVDDSDQKWVSTWGNGILILDGENAQILNEGNSQLPSNYIYDVSFDKNNQAWTQTSEGLTVFDGSKWENYNISNSGLAYGGVNWVYFSRNGRIWLSNDGIVIDGKVWKRYIMPVKLFELRGDERAFDQNGNLWITEILDPLSGRTGRILFVPADVRLVSNFEIFLSFLVISGGSVFLSLLIAECCLAILLKSSKVMWVSFIITILIASFWFYIDAFEFVGHPTINQMRSMSQLYFIGNPGIIIATSVMTFGLIARAVRRTLKSEVIGIVLGWLLGIPLGFFLLLVADFSLMGP